MLKIESTKKFRKDLDRMEKRGVKLDLMRDMLEMLASQKPIDRRYHDHELSGEYDGLRECHIQPDWLLIYAIDGDRLILTATRTGTHSDLF